MVGIFDNVVIFLQIHFIGLKIIIIMGFMNIVLDTFL